MSVSAYKRTMRDTQSPRDIERQILSRITGALSTYAKSFDEAEDNSHRLAVLAGGLQIPLNENIRLWNALKVDLARDDNALGEALRAQLISLALYVERETGHILRGTGKISALVAVNRSIIEGLAGIAPAQEAV